jgi:hypothetical protein
VRRLLIGTLLLTAAAAGQSKRFDWVPTQSRSYRLEPEKWQAAVNYGITPLHLRISVQATNPVTLAVVRTEDWNNALQHKDAMAQLPLQCQSQGLTHSTYTCDLENLDGERMLIVRDQHSPNVVLSDAMTMGIRAAARNLTAATELTLTGLRWACVQGCDPPEYGWVNAFKEKFQLTPIGKTYGPLTPDRDGAEMHVKLKAPIPMLVAVLPVAEADRLRANPLEADKLLAGVACKQRAMQSAEFNCTLKLADGTQQIVLMPEPGVNVPKKKAEIKVDAVRCIANCQNR